MLYGYKEKVDNCIATIVSAADTVEEYEEWVGKVSIQSPHPNFAEYSVSKLMDHLTRDEFHGYKRPVLIVLHSDIIQRDRFVDEWEITQVQTAIARDMQKTMVFRKSEEDRAKREALEESQASIDGTELVGRSIEELYGLTENDPWDKRSEEQKQSDTEAKKLMKDLQKQGKISDDSFGGADVQRKAKAEANKNTVAESKDSVAHVTDIRTKENADGSIEIDNALARKFHGEVDQIAAKANDQEQQDKVLKRKKGKTVFSPEDFAEALRGDGSADHLNVPADDDAIKQRREPGRAPVFSPEAEKARKKYQAKQEAKASAVASKRKIADDNKAKVDHANGIFRGSILEPDDTIAVADLPESIKHSLKVNKIEGDTLPLKDYPFNSAIRESILLPCNDSPISATQIWITDNLEVKGVIEIKTASVVVASPKDSSIPSWVVYVSNQSNGSDAVNEQDQHTAKRDVVVIRIRSYS
jgi:hypothetical protein